MVEVTPRRDGRVSRAQAAALCRVDPDTISQWISRGHLKDVKREGRRVWLEPVELQRVEYKLRERARRPSVSVAA
jgi:hypothetical protein